MVLRNLFKLIFLKSNMVKIDKEKCIGCGLCVSMVPEVFEIDEAGKAEVIVQKNNPDVKEAAESCPGEAIIL